MCFPGKVKTSQMKIFKQKFTELLTLKHEILSEPQISHYYLERLAFMEQSIKRDLSGIKKIISCADIPEIEGNELFDQAFLQCALDEKLNYFSKALDVVRNAPDISKIVSLEIIFKVSVKSFVCWGSKEKAKIKGLRFVIGQYQIDLRRYLLRQSKSSIQNSYVLSAIYPSKPEQLRFSFENQKTLDQDLQLLMYAAEISFKFMVEIWLKKPEKMDGRMSFSLLSAQRMSPETLIKQNSMFGQSEDGKKKSIKKAQVKRFKFQQQSENDQKKQKKVHSEKGLSVHKLYNEKKEPLRNRVTLPTTPALTEQTLSPRKFSSFTQSPMSRNEKNLLKVLFPHYHLQDLQSLTGYFNLSFHKSKKCTIKLYKHRIENRIKAKIKFIDIETQEIVKGLLDYFKWSSWNQKVKRGDVLMKLESQNCLLSTLEWKNVKAPPFCFLTHLCQYQKSYYIGIKIYTNQVTSKQMRNMYFTAGIIKISSLQNETQIFFDLYYESSSSFSIQFISSISSLELYLNQEQYHFKQHLKFGWYIDKQMKKQFVDEHERRSNQYSYGSWEFGNVEDMQITDEQNSFRTIHGDSSELDHFEEK